MPESIRGVAANVAVALVFLLMALVTLAQSNDYDRLVTRAKSELSLGHNQEALADSKKALALQVKGWEARMIAGCALHSEKRYDEAINEFSHALFYAPADKQDVAHKLLENCRSDQASGQIPWAKRGYDGPACLYCPRPQYTPEALDAKLEGDVLLTAVVTADGRATDVHVREVLASA